MMLLHWILICLLHPVHVSVTEVTYSEKDKALQITSRIFIDDLELSIQKQVGQESLDILKPRNGLTTDQLVSDYLKKHLTMKMDGKPANIKYLAHETEDAAMICYLEIENVKKLKTLEVTIDVIHETHTDQSNLVHITYKGPVKSYRLVREKPTEIFRTDNK
jgi:hypothetical protein